MLEKRAPKADALPGCATPRPAESLRFQAESPLADTGFRGKPWRNTAGTGVSSPDYLPNLPIIYHGTPMTPRAALDSVLAGRAACVSFYRPDDVEAVEAVCPQIMFRQRGVFLLDEGAPVGARPDRSGQERLVRLLRLAGASTVPAGPVGDYSGSAGGPIPAQRRVAERLAIWTFPWSTRLAHGRPDRTPPSTMRALRSHLSGLDRGSEEGASRMPRLPFPNGGSSSCAREPVAGPAYASWDSCCAPVPLCQRRQHQPRAERVAL